MDKPLRILGIVHLPWDPRLGAVRVWFELSEQWKKSGHKIDKYCLSDAFPKATRSRALFAWRQAIFPYRAARFVRRNADKFDVVGAMEQWVEKGQPPTRVVASHSTNGTVDRTRPLCAYPQVARYTGKGSTDDAANFTCRLP